MAYTAVGAFEWDERDGHRHWHLEDVARYRLLDTAGRAVAISPKTGFCLANTDAVDLLLQQADWQPAAGDLRTACGDETSLAVQEALAIGSGDTYTSGLPGQSFDITDLPNGTYFIEVAANPDGTLVESDTGNNVSLRRVVLGGTPGRRALQVPPVGLVDG